MLIKYWNIVNKNLKVKKCWLKEKLLTNSDYHISNNAINIEITSIDKIIEKTHWLHASSIIVLP